MSCTCALARLYSCVSRAMTVVSSASKACISKASSYPPADPSFCFHSLLSVVGVCLGLAVAVDSFAVLGGIDPVLLLLWVLAPALTEESRKSLLALGVRLAALKFRSVLLWEAVLGPEGVAASPARSALLEMRLQRCDFLSLPHSFMYLASRESNESAPSGTIRLNRLAMTTARIGSKCIHYINTPK